MTPERWSRLKDVFDHATELPPEARGEFLKQACGADAELRAELDRLLAEDDRDSGLLSQVAGHAAALGSEPPPRFLPGTVLARRFRIVRFLARGGMGEVYEAEDTELGGQVALKAIRPETARDGRALAWFKREIQLARKVTHPHVCRIYDLVQHEHAGASTMLLSMELVAGQTLARYLKQHGPLTPQAALPLIEQMAAALQAAHEAGVIHRDFKPGNVMLAAGADPPRAVVMDFGLAFPAAPAGAGKVTGPGSVQGTPNYMAPEQRQGGPITPATDVYALGLVIQEMIGQEEPGPADHRTGVWGSVLDRCLRRDAARRYATATEVVEALRAALVSPSRSRRVLLWGLGFAAALAFAGTVVVHPWQPNPLAGFEQGNWVLVDGFENRTGEPLFDDVLKASLERELGNSGFVSLAGPERIGDALAMMKKPPDAPLDRALAREVALRDGAITVLITGRTEKSAQAYRLTAELVDPVSDRVLAVDTEQAPAQDQIHAAVRRLSNWVRESLGEEMNHIDLTNAQLEKATTPSLAALQAFSKADAAAKRGAWEMAAQFARQALAEDPNFASAHIWLAYALKSLGRPEWEYEAQRARELASTATEREHLFIEGSYWILTNQPAQAIPVLSELVRRYPDHYFSYPNLSNALELLGQQDKAAEIAARNADLRPNSFGAYARAAYSLRRLDLSRAAQYARRAILLAPRPYQVTGNTADVYATFVFSLPFFDVWETDAKRALAEVNNLAATFAEPSDLILDWRIGELYLALGQVRAARDWFARTIPPDAAPAIDIYALYVAGDEAGARARTADLRGTTEPPDPRFLIARLRPDAPSLFTPPDRAQQPGPPRNHRLGEVALAQGRVADAVELLQSNFDNFPGLRTTQMIAESLARALDLSGDREKAVAVLEQAGKRTRMPMPAFWIRNQAHLSAYYHAQGREAEAQEIDDRLRQLLAVADSDFPILKQLNR